MLIILQDVNWDAVTAITAVLSILISIGALFIAILSRGDAKQSAIQAKRSADAADASVPFAKSSAEAANISAQAAKDSIEIAKQSVIAAEQSVEVAKSAITINIEVFKRQGVIALFDSWKDIRDINPIEPITPDIINAVHALELIAALWNHDIVKKEILHQSFWDDFKVLYDNLNATGEVPELNKKGTELLSKRVSKCYEEMKKFDHDKEASSKVDN